MRITEQQKRDIVLDILLVCYSERATPAKAERVLNLIRALDDNRDEKGRFTKKEAK